MTTHDFTTRVGWNEAFGFGECTTESKKRSAVRVKDPEGWMKSIHDLLRAERDLLLLAKKKKSLPETAKRDIRKHYEDLAGATQDSARSLDSEERRSWRSVKYNWKYYQQAKSFQPVYGQILQELAKIRI